MGDRCYMQVTCRRQDQPAFEALGFHLEFEESADCPIIEMIDEEANYAHHGVLPAKVPFLASHGPGGNYGDGLIACDGQRYAEVEAGHDGGFVLHWDEKTNQPASESQAHVREYLAVHQTVQELFQSLSVPPILHA